MASNYLLLLVILSIVKTSLQDTHDNEVEVEEANPFAEAASAILKEQNAQNIGSMVNNFLQSGGADQLGSMLSNLGGENTGQLLEGLGSLLGSDKKTQTRDKRIKGEDLLGSLGSLVGAFQGTGGGGGGSALLQGLGALLGTQRAGGQQGLNPAVIGSLVNMFTQNSDRPSKAKSKKSPQKQQHEKKIHKAEERQSEPGFDISGFLSLAGSFLGSGKNEEGGILNYLPMIMQTIQAFSGPEAEQRAESHSDHSWLLPPFMEKIHIAFDHFINSELGKLLINALGAERTFKVFTDEKGRFSYQKFVEMIENHSFRRHWIRLVTDRIADMLQYASNPKTQKPYLSSARLFINSYLKGQGFPKSALFDPARPTETVSALIDHASEKYLQAPIKSKGFVKSAWDYIQEAIRLTQKGGTLGDSKELSNKLADTVNLEIIEPIARVNRAYRFAKSVPSCDRYVFCLVNQENTNEVESLPGLKKMLYKGASLVAGWFLSSDTGTPFWTLYTDITEDTNCKTLYSDKCNDFHVEEIKVTTEYVHSEL